MPYARRLILSFEFLIFESIIFYGNVFDSLKSNIYKKKIMLYVWEY